MKCRLCEFEIEPDLRTLARLGKRRTVSARADSIYRCRCGVSYSNATREAKRVLIRARPELNVPEPVRSGLAQVLAQSVNATNRGSKQERFCFETSEDALTWTVVRYLESVGRLDALLDREPPAGVMPSVLFWGAPSPDSLAIEMAQLLEKISSGLRENPDRRSEPDVIVVWPELAVLVEAKYRSGNDRKPDYQNFDRYLDRAGLFAVPAEKVKRDGYYELARNWRIGVELAERLHTSFLLINLGPPRIGQTAADFARTLVQTAERRFIHRSWSAVLTALGPIESWFDAYARTLNLHSL